MNREKEVKQKEKEEDCETIKRKCFSILHLMATRDCLITFIHLFKKIRIIKSFHIYFIWLTQIEILKI